MKRVYLDANVFISAHKEEMGRNARGLFIEAESFFNRMQNNFILILSEFFFAEVKKHSYLSMEEVLKYFNDSRIKTEIVGLKEKLLVKKYLKKGIHFSDALHAAAAIENKCDCIVTFNTKDFEKISKEILVLEPNEFF
ncbi:MAG: type II toxin-antitoxin system VapC family toxin [archaeon]